jgi:hypothetical protein
MNEKQMLSAVGLCLQTRGDSSHCGQRRVAGAGRGALDLHTHCLILRSLLRAPSVPTTTRPAYLYLLSAFGDLGIPDGELKAKRKPR